MAELSPRIDTREASAILAQIRALAPYYTPEWAASENTGSGAAILSIFARMFEGLLQRLNEVPRRNFITFLNRLGAHLLPAQPARVPLTFLLSTGATEGALIPAGAQGVATPPGSEPIVFETERAILATPARLAAVLSIAPARDHIYRHGIGAPASTPAELFAATNKNQQEHSLYLAHSRLFDLKEQASIDIRLVFSGAGSTAQNLTEDLVWEWWNGQAWVPSTAKAFSEPQVQAAFPTVTGLAADLSAVDAMWMEMSTDVSSDARFPDSGVVLIDDEFIAYGARQARQLTQLSRGLQGSNVANHHRGAQVRLVDAPFQVGTSFVTNTPEGAKVVTITLEKSVKAKFAKVAINGNKNFWIRCRALQTPTLQESLLRDLLLDTIQVGSAASALVPDALFRGDVPLNVPSADKPIYPFGTRPRLLDTFYIASGDALSKQGQMITFDFDIALAGAIGVAVRQVQGIGPNFETRLKAAGITTVNQLLAKTSQELAPILQTNVTRAHGIREAAAKEFYDAAGRDPATLDPDLPEADELALSWEYWDGKGWQRIAGIYDDPASGTDRLRRSGKLTFPCPTDSKLIAINGQENQWVRVRIVAGDYGREVYKVETDGRVTSDTTPIDPPMIRSLKINYGDAQNPDLENLEACVSYNNLTFVEHTYDAATPQQTFTPFPLLSDAHQAVYLGFDRQLVDGPISIFFSFVEQAYTQESLPQMVWEYFRSPANPGDPGAWIRLNVVDGTQNLTESGAIEFLSPPDLGSTLRFGQALFWLRVVDLEDKFQPRPKLLDLSQESSASMVAASPIAGCPANPCPELLALFHPTFSLPPAARNVAALPLLNGIYLNTAWASQGETTQNEILGSGTGLRGQAFTLTKLPVVSEAIWVNELDTLSEGERRTLAATSGVTVDAPTDAQDNTIAFWIRWTVVDDLETAPADARVYAIDRTFGLVTFGDGKHGLPPPLGRDNIQATYQAGGGLRGNVASGLVKTLRTTIPFVDGVTNPEAAGGGSDTELPERALERVPQTIRNGGRAVTAEDYEALAQEASRAVVRVKCLPCFDDNGAFKTNWVTVIIVPGSAVARPLPSPRLRQGVANYLRARAANVTVFPEHIQVVGPTYVEVTVRVDVYPATIDQTPVVRAEAVRRLVAFLHPLTGGYQGRGWEFGRLPCLADFYSLLESISGLDHVENLVMALRAVTPEGITTDQVQEVSENRPLGTTMPDYALLYSGDHQVTIRTLR